MYILLCERAKFRSVTRSEDSSVKKSWNFTCIFASLLKIFNENGYIRCFIVKKYLAKVENDNENI